MFEEHFGKTFKRVLKEIDEKKGLVFLVIDPPDQSPEEAGIIAELAEKAGVSAFAVGGSVGAQGSTLDKTIKEIKSNSSLPVILFPGNIATLSPKADAAYFMSMLNSRDPYFISGAQTASSLPIKKMKLETIPTSYLVFEPGKAVGWIGQANLIPRDVPYIGVAAALAGQFMGSHLVILESGSGAPSCVPPENVKAIASVIDIPIVVAGGVKTPKLAFDAISAGASIVHVGTAIDNVHKNKSKALELMKEFVASAEKGGKNRN
ncbi:MAG: geranylgeranylglyceryl/heptaprenylglyceryl phosphate synthase [archaeon]